MVWVINIHRVRWCTYQAICVSVILLKMNYWLCILSIVEYSYGERVLCFLTVMIYHKSRNNKLLINFYLDYTLEILFNNEELGKYCFNNDIWLSQIRSFVIAHLKWDQSLNGFRINFSYQSTEWYIQMWAYNINIIVFYLKTSTVI